MYENLFNSLNSLSPISEALKDKLSLMLQTKEVSKKSYLLRDGQVSNYIYFIERGLIRSYYLKGPDEINSWFMIENDVAIAVNSFFTRAPSYEFLQTLEDSTIHMLHYDNLQSLYKEFIEFNLIGRLLTQKYYVLSEERIHGLRKQRAEERYRILLETQPEIVRRVPRKDIASYLGITIETLSRMRFKP